MLRIECPWCGLRDETEFSFGGETGVVRPSPAVSDGEWADYLFFRSNRKGPQGERWVHTHGCRQWLVVERDTVTHQITRVQRIEDALVDLSGGKP